MDASPEVPFDEYPQACQHVYRLPKKKKIRFYTRAYYVISVKKYFFGKLCIYSLSGLSWLAGSSQAIRNTLESGTFPLFGPTYLSIPVSFMGIWWESNIAGSERIHLNPLLGRETYHYQGKFARSRAIIC